MFISIPKDTKIPSIFTKEFILNKENNHLEFDTEQYRNDEPGITPGENDDNARINGIITNLDEEYASENTEPEL